MATINKHRPSLTSEEILHLMSLCRETISRPMSVQCMALLARFEYNIKNGASKPSHSVKAPLSDEEKFGLDLAKPPIDIYERRKLAYDKWLVDPSNLSISELEDVQSYRMSNDPSYEPSLEEILGTKT